MEELAMLFIFLLKLARKLLVTGSKGPSYK